MDFTAIVLCLFVLLCQAEGDVKEETLYVKTGTDLLLDVGEPVTLNEHESMVWKFQCKVNIVKLTQTNESAPLGIYKGKAELFPLNKSLLLKNVQKNDSGEYRAGVSGDTNRDLAQYQVTVVDPVSDVKLEVKQCSSDRSDLTVTCSILDGRLSSTFICENTNCSHEGGEPVLNIPPGVSMKVYLTTGSVTCHHSNNASSTKDTKTIEDLCGIKEKDPGESAPQDEASKIYVPIIFIIISIAALLVVVFGATVVCYLQSGRQGGRQEVEDPVYADVSAALQRERHLRPGPRNGAQVESPDVIYSTVSAHRAAPAEAPTEPTVKMTPESYYATVRKTAKS